MESVTHNCKLLCCELPDGVIMRVPVGYHVHMTRDVEGICTMISQCLRKNSTRNKVDEEPLCGCATSKSLLNLFI